MAFTRASPRSGSATYRREAPAPTRKRAFYGHLLRDRWPQSLDACDR